jgi:hypothetical protein
VVGLISTALATIITSRSSCDRRFVDDQLQSIVALLGGQVVPRADRMERGDSTVLFSAG